MTKTINRRGVWILTAAFVLVTVAVLWILFCKVLVIRNVLVEGTSAATDEEIIRASAIDLGGSIRKVDEAKLRANLESSGKFALESVYVQYPNTVVLTVRDRTKDAMIMNGGKMLVLDSDGYVIEVHDTVPENSGVYVTGLNFTNYRIGTQIALSETQMLAFHNILEALRSQQAADLVSDVNMSDVNDLRITTRTGILVKLGDADNMETKILWMRSAVLDLESRQETKGTLDVSSATKADYMP